MITNMAQKPKSGVAALACAPIQGASQLHVAAVVLMAPIAVPFQGGAVSDAKRGGQGSRAWSPPA
ncbi:hypothetical protein FB561_6227 [Kribbella amoyensis]|uniref:Uncharacterized protein n=1 Tax=Kribbella amoyensis TaxID=996641 RepID=A0A561B743_9ACTN|nr:hypothetical protein [Kribbella amoyensis]TWD74795.1 hypothetical protein FB561_6227 [Kribbella amoyensis]